MAFLLEHAGGKASTGKGTILEIVPKSIHEKCPVFLGSADNIDAVEVLK
jgi:fructose-1,6-bisphosphatase I